GRPRAPGRRRPGALARPEHRRRRARAVRRRLDRDEDRHLRRGQPRQGRRRPGDPEREPRARARRDRRPAPEGRDGVSVTAAAGFVAWGVAAGIKYADRPDLAIVRSVPHATGGAMFTRNRVQAAPLAVCREHLALAEPQAVVINAGIANAATGERGKI